MRFLAENDESALAQHGADVFDSHGALGDSFSLRSKRNEALVVCCLATVAQPQAKGETVVWHGADHFLARSMAVTS